MLARCFIFFSLLGNSQITGIAEEWKQNPLLKHASYGFCIREASTSSVIAEYNSDLALIPASTLKVATTGAALSVLGRNFRFETKIHHTGTFDKNTGVITGDLIITGFGDPTLQSDNFSRGNITDTWATILKEKGVKEIKGKITGDASYFERKVPDNWVWGDIGNYYAATPCALSYMDNKFTIAFSTGRAGTKARLSSNSAPYTTRTITVNSDVVAGGNDDQAYVYGDPWGWIKEVKGTLPPNKTNFEIEAALPDPALLCAEALQRSLLREGIKCGPQVSSLYEKSDTLIKKYLLHLHFSPTLDRIIHYTNLTSNNLYCESLIMALGKGNMYSGLNAVETYWSALFPGSEELHMTDGSGLSRASTITPALQSGMLCSIFADSLTYRIINASFPLAGKSGSMGQIGKGTFIENNLRAKTGYINRVRAYCGYVNTRSGKTLAFSVILNNYFCTAKEAKSEIEKLLVRLAEPDAR